MQLEGVYQVRRETPVRIAVSLTEDETKALLCVLTPTALSYRGHGAAHGEEHDATRAQLSRLREDLASMAKRRGWLSEA